MKHQYFGDVRDLFMFDLVLEILRGTDLERFTYIPMLTRDTDSEYVLKTDMERAVAGRDNTLLRDYLETCYRDGKRSIYETEGIFHLPGFNRYRYAIHRTRFQDEVRMQYFLEVPGEELGSALILIDPDEGVWSPDHGRQGEKFLRYDEVRHLYQEMDDGSVLVLFHHLPRKARYSSLTEVQQKLKEWVTRGRPVLSISDRRETFFLLTRDNDRQRQLEDVVRDYDERYRLKLEDD